MTKDLCFYHSPIGRLGIAALDNQITDLFFCESENNNLGEFNQQVTPLLQVAINQLQLYFAGQLREFDLPLLMAGTPFQKQVWAELQKIPYATTTSYGQIAQNLDNPKAMRAVGNANNKNPIAIIVPCHRVIGKNGKLVGYAGGLHIKEYLLNLEAKVSGR